MNITKEEFLEIYAGLPICDYVDLFYSKPKDEQDLIKNFLTSKMWRLNNLYTIVNKFGELVTFVMNRSQHKVYAASLRHPRIIILKSRQQGISTLWLVSFFDDALIYNNFSIGLMAQGQDEASTLLDRTKILWDKLDSNFKRYIKVSNRKDNTKEFSFTNGSNIFIRTSFRSTTLQRLHVSEMGKIANKYPEKARETKTGTLQALAPGNIGVIESTAEGDNLFRVDWDNAVKFKDNLSLKDFYPVFLSWLDDPDCKLWTDQVVTVKAAEYFAEIEAELGVTLRKEQKNFWIVQFRELGDRVYQEYPSTANEAFMATKDGTYYAKLYLNYVKAAKREVSGLHDKNLDTQIAVDLGMNDTMSLGFFQTYMEDETRIVDEYTASGEDIAHYCNVIKEKAEANSYNITHLILPHDAKVKDLTSGKTREERFREELPNVMITVLERSPRGDGIEAVRVMIKKLFVDLRCEYIISCLYNYSKEWNDNIGSNGGWSSQPLHDEYSNGADMLRYMAMGKGKYVKKMLRIRKSREGFDV
jgi:hypothetical protein